MASPFIICKGGANPTGSELYLRLHREFEVSNDIWHRHKQDFDGESWELGRDISTEDSQRQGDGRTGIEIDSFSETMTIELNNDYNSGLLQSLYECTLQGDAYFRDFLEAGLDAKIVQRMPNGGYTQKIYECCSVSAVGALFDQLTSTEATSELELSLGNEPEVANVGFSPSLPKSRKEVTAKYEITTSGTDIDVKVTDIVDEDNNIEGDWVATLFDWVTGEIVGTETSTEGVFAFTGVQASTQYAIAVGYVYMSLDGVDYSKYIHVEQIKTI